MAYTANRRWSTISLMQLANKLSQNPASDPKADRSKILSPTKTITKDDFFPMIAVSEDDSGISMRTIIVPENSLKLTWDLFGFAIIIYQALIIPYQIGFDVQTSGGLLVLDYLIHGFFVIDILLTFNTAYYYKGMLVMRRKLIAKYYLRIWFWIDLISTFPYEFIMQAVPGGESIYSENGSAAYKTPQMVRLIKMINFIRILKLLRLAKLKRIMYQVEDYISGDLIGSFFVFLRLALSGFFIAHWTACSWYMTSSFDSEMEPDTWVKLKNVWVAEGANRGDAYVASLYWAVTTMNTIGYGDIYAITNNEKICAICAMVVTCGVFAYILGNISNVVNKKNELEAVHRKRVISLNSYMKQKELPHELRFRVRRYLDYIWEHQEKNKMEEDDILAMLSEPLRDEIYTHTRGPVFNSFALFETFSPNFTALLSKELNPEVFAPGDGVFDEGEKTYKMFFMVSGTVDVYHKGSQSSFKLLHKGDVFGEIGFFAKLPRTASVRCLEFVNMLSLSRDGIEHILVRMPDAKETIQVIEEKCQAHDYTVLKISCYLCKTLGHVALMCNKMILTRIKDEFRDKWIRGRRGNTIFVNPKIAKPNFIRKDKKLNPHLRFGKGNVIGMFREAEELYPDDTGISRKIGSFMDEKQLQQPATSIAQSRRSSMEARARLPKRLSIILSETPVGDEQEGVDVCRIPRFDFRLLRSASLHAKGEREDSTPSSRTSKDRFQEGEDGNAGVYRRVTESQMR